MVYEFNKRKVVLRKNEYSNGNLAVSCFIAEGSKKNRLYAVLTVNFGNKTKPDCAYIDINNMDLYIYCYKIDVVKWIIDNKIGELTGETKEIVDQFGTYTYPEIKFDLRCLE